MPLLVMKGYITLVLNKTIGGGDGEIILCSSSIVREKRIDDTKCKQEWFPYI